MENPGPLRLTIDTNKIEHNARSAVALCHSVGVHHVMGVTKAAPFLPVARAMIRGGVKSIGDSRLDNVRGLRQGLPNDIPVFLVRSPAPSEVEACVAHADGSFNVDSMVLEKLAATASRQGRVHRVVLMVDVDHTREGVSPSEAPDLCLRIHTQLPGLHLEGVGSYFSFGSDSSHWESSFQRLVGVAHASGEVCGMSLPVVSGGSSNVLDWITSSTRAREIAAGSGMGHLRLGTAILLGLRRSGPPTVPYEGVHDDACLADVEIIERKTRADGRIVALCAMGVVDVDIRFLFPTWPGVQVLTASSDHTILDVTDAGPPAPGVGDRVAFKLGYYALSRLALSPYVRLHFL